MSIPVAAAQGHVYGWLRTVGCLGTVRDNRAQYFKDKNANVSVSTYFD